MTDRLKAELEKLWRNSKRDTKALVFEVSEIKRSFATACRLAGITDFRFHDLRHTATTRIAGIVKETTTAMRITGHTQIKTFMRYNNVDVEIAQRVGAMMNEERAAAAQESDAPSHAPNVASLDAFRRKKAAGK